MRTRLKHFFGRELEWLARAASLLWALRGEGAAGLRRPGGPALEARDRRRVRRPPGGTRSPGVPRARVRRRPRRARREVLSLLASLTLHVALVALLAVIPRERHRGAVAPREITVSFRLIPRSPPAKPPVVPEAAAPEREPEERDRPDRTGEPRSAAAFEAPPAAERPSPPEPEPARDQDRETTRAPEVHPEPPPALLGLGPGPAPPPLPAARPRTVEGAELYPSRSSGKASALKTRGGNARTEEAVGAGLRWLGAHQDRGGGWDADGFTRHCHEVLCWGRGFPEHDVALTALSLLAFLGAGHGPDRPGPYRDAVAGGLDYLLALEDSSGAFGPEGTNYFYGHALATFALAEAFGLTGHLPYRRALERALTYSRAGQQPAGGWDYTSRSPEGRSDLSITGWQVLAMRSAAAAGVEPPPGMEEGTRRFLARAFTPAGEGIYADRGTGAGRRGINMVAVGLLSDLSLGAVAGDGAVQAAADRLIGYGALPEREALRAWDRTYQSYYYWYAATLCLFHLSDRRPRAWEAWNMELQRVLLPLQRRDGHAAGSWDPEPSWIGASGGRIYATAINVLTLEVYYRYEPLLGTRKE